MKTITMKNNVCNSFQLFPLSRYQQPTDIPTREAVSFSRVSVERTSETWEKDGPNFHSFLQREIVIVLPLYMASQILAAKVWTSGTKEYNSFEYFTMKERLNRDKPALL